MCRCIMEVYYLGNFLCFFSFKFFIKRTFIMGIQVIDDKANIFCFRIFSYQSFYKKGEVFLRSLPCNFSKSFSALGLNSHENICFSSSNILIILLCNFSRFNRNWSSTVLNQLLWLFIQTNDRYFGIIWLFVEIKKIIHPPSELWCNLFDAPHLF